MDSVRIPLSRGQFVLVDAADAPALLAHSWRAHRVANRRVAVVAARSERLPDGSTRWVTMHREILGAPPEVLVDHVSDDGLDNRRSNLRAFSPRLRGARRRLYPRSGYRGVKQRGSMWLATISPDGRSKYLGAYNDAETAARVYDQAALEAYGEFACLNFPPNGPPAPGPNGVDTRPGPPPSRRRRSPPPGRRRDRHQQHQQLELFGGSL